VKEEGDSDGNTFASRNLYSQEIVHYNKAIELDSQRAEAYINWALAYKEMGNKVDAIADFEKLLLLVMIIS